MRNTKDKDFENFVFLIDSNGLSKLVDDFENGDLKSSRGIDFIEILKSKHRVILEKIFATKKELKYGELIKVLKKNYLTIRYDLEANNIKDLRTFLKNKKMIVPENKILTYNLKFYSVFIFRKKHLNSFSSFNNLIAKSYVSTANLGRF